MRRAYPWLRDGWRTANRNAKCSFRRFPHTPTPTNELDVVRLELLAFGGRCEIATGLVFRVRDAIASDALESPE